MSNPPTADYFFKARAVSASLLFAAAAAAIIGSLLDWLVVDETPPTVPADQADRLPPFSGLDVGDGYIVIGAAAFVIVAAILIVLRGTSGFGWLALVACIVMGGIAISDYRGIAELHADLDAIGTDPDPGFGLTLVAAAAFVGLVASAAAIAASPKRRDD